MARDVFKDPFAGEWLDDREDYGEDCYVIIGMVKNRLNRGLRRRLLIGLEPDEDPISPGKRGAGSRRKNTQRHSK